MATKNDDFTTKADELLAARRSMLQPLVPPAGITLQPLVPPTGITLQPLEPPTGITLQPMDLPGVTANPTRHVNEQTTSEHAPAAATGDGAPHET